MKDDFVSRHEATDESCITNVNTHQVDALSDLFREIVQPAMDIEGIVLGQSGNFGYRRKKAFGKVRTDKPVGSVTRI
jgi:hypothetical protein